MDKHPKILVVGSIATDFIMTADRLPSYGESVIGSSFTTAAGGKGANQAVQAAKLGAAVTLVGAVGDDSFGSERIRAFEQVGIDTSRIVKIPGVPTGVAGIEIEKRGDSSENRILVIPGANMRIEKSHVEFLKDEIGSFDIVLLQNEIPQEINRYVADVAATAGVPVMLNPAPAGEISQDLAASVTYLSPNEHEAALICKIDQTDENFVEKALRKMADMGISKPMITLGSKGSAMLDCGEIILTPCVDSGAAVDPTAAGDSFVGTFCTSVASGMPSKQAMMFASAAAGITVTRMGAQPSLPTADEVENLLNKIK